MRIQQNPSIFVILRFL